MLAQSNVGTGVPFKIHGLPDVFGESGEPSDLYRKYRMDESGIDMQVLSLGSPGVQNFEPSLAGSLARLANDPFPDAPPRYVRALLYRYEFVPSGDPSGGWWRRTLLRTWIPPLAADDPRLQRFLESRGLSP